MSTPHSQIQRPEWMLCSVVAACQLDQEGQCLLPPRPNVGTRQDQVECVSLYLCCYTLRDAPPAPVVPFSTCIFILRTQRGLPLHDGPSQSAAHLAFVAVSSSMKTFGDHLMMQEACISPFGDHSHASCPDDHYSHNF